MKFLKFLPVLLYLWAGTGICAVYSYIDSVTQPAGSSYYNVDVVMSWDPNDTTTNPCNITGAKFCAIISEIYNDRNSTLNTRLWQSDYESCFTTKANLGLALGCLSVATVNPTNVTQQSFTTVGSSVTARLLTSYSGAQACARLRYIVFNASLASIANGEIPVVCGLPPPPIGACSMPDSIELDHGTVAMADVNGSAVVKAFNIECNMDVNASMVLTTQNAGVIALGSGLDSKIDIDGYTPDSNRKFTLKSGANSFNIRSVLTKTGDISSGAYSGQSALILTLD